MRATISGPSGTIGTNGSTPQFIGVMGALARVGVPLRVKGISEGMDEIYVVTRNGDWKTEISAILQRLMKIGAVYHPDIPNAPKHHYCLAKGVQVQVEF